MLPLPVFLLLHSGGQVQQSNVSAASSVPSGPSAASVTFRSDGQATSSGNVASSHPISGEWWSQEPQTGIGAQYEIRCVSADGSFTGQAAPIGTWVDMSSNRLWSVTRGQVGPGTNS